MPERFDWTQILILLIIFGGGIVRFIVQNLASRKNPQGQAEQPPRAKSPALEILDTIREQNESVVTRQAQVPAGDPHPGRPVDPADAHYKDEGLALQSPPRGEDVFFVPQAPPRKKQQPVVSAPKPPRRQVRKQEREIEDDLAIHTRARSSARRRTGSLRLPKSLGGGRMSLQHAIIGQVILGPPKALEKRNGVQPGRVRFP